jgi:regulator of protease activity HflC (stomatin/prohibitin superfamily)
MLVPIVVLAVVGVILLSMSVRILQEYERGVLFRLGRVLSQPRGPGVVFVIPVVDRMVRVNLQVTTVDVPAQNIVTRDNVTLRVNAVAYFRVHEAIPATVEMQDYRSATFQIAQTTLRAVLTQSDLDQILSERDRLNTEIQRILDDVTESWGIKVTNVEIREIDLPPHTQRVMAGQAQAERERRAKVVAAEGEFQASQRLAEAAEILARDPIAFQLRFLQTLSEIASERNRSVMIPIPVEMLRTAKRAQERAVSRKQN